MKFKLKRSLFYIVIFLIVCVGIISSLILRNSIIKYDYDSFVSEKNQYLYYPYKDLKYSGGVFTDITTDNNIDMNNFSDYIVKGIATGKHEILEGAVLTQIKIIKVIKGDINQENIYIYEPISIEMGKGRSKYLVSMLGYNFIKHNEEYVFCINKFSNIEGHFYTEKEKKSYVYKNPFLAKFPMKYNDSDFKIGEENEVNTNNNSDEYVNCEQVFLSKKNKELYLKYREQVVQITN